MNNDGIRSDHVVHPEGRPLSDFERSLWRLKMIGHEVTMLICSITESEERKQDTRLLFTATNYGQILVCKFLEAWDSFNALAESNRRVKEIAQAVSPAIRRITKTWPRIRHYRNWALAHPYSIREESEITPPWKLLDLGVAPNQNAEVFLLLECVRFATAKSIVRCTLPSRLVALKLREA
jgi:hypothetical protein